MAIRLDNKYPGRVNPADPSYPDGSIKNETVPDVSNDGTPLDELWGNDFEGLKQAVFLETGIVPNDASDTALSSQWLVGLKKILGLVREDYTALRLVTSDELVDKTACMITADGIGGNFVLDQTDAVTADNGVTVIVDADGGRWKRLFNKAVDAKWAGAIGDGVADDRAAIIAALATGYPVILPDGRYLLSASIALPNNADIHGGLGAVVYQSGSDLTAFTATDLDYFELYGFTIEGLAASPGDIAGGAVSVIRCADFNIEKCAFDTWMMGGVWCIGSAASNTSGSILNNTFVKGDVSGTTTGYGVQDNAPIQVYESCNNIIAQDNKATGEWYCFALVQDRINSGASRIYDMNISNNTGIGMSNYGIALYTVAQTITGIADNGAGLFRVTVAGHDCATGDIIHLESSGSANGIWVATVIDADNIDLQNSVYSAAANGNLRLSENCSGVYANNIIKGVKGTRENPPGSKPYGMGFYLQAVGGIILANNEVLDCCQQTDTQTLTPGAIGLNGATGPITVNGGIISDSGYNGIDASNTFSGTITVGGGLQISRSAERDVFINSCDNINISNITIIPRNLSAILSNRCLYAQSSNNVHIDQVKILGATKQSRMISLFNVTNYSVTNSRAINASPAADLIEAAYFEDCDDGEILGNNFNGDASPGTALTLDAVTNTIVDANRIKMTADGAARATVRMIGVCTDTMFTVSNSDAGGRMENTSTGGSMHTKSTTDSSGGKTRQIGDTILKTDPVSAGVIMHVKVAVSSGSADWEDVSIAA